MEYIVECVRLTPFKIGKVAEKFDVASPKKAIENFIARYLAPIEEPEIRHLGLPTEPSHCFSYKVQLKHNEDYVFFLSCRYLAEKK